MAPPLASNSKFYITSLHLADAPALADRIAAAFEGEALHESWVAPISPPEERRRRVREFRIARLEREVQHPLPGKFVIVARRARGHGRATEESSDGGTAADQAILQAGNEDDEAVGFAVWEAPVLAEADAVDQSPSKSNAPANPESVVLQHVRASIDGTLTAMRARVWGSPAASDFWCLSSLSVDPAFQGQGVGQMLVAWGCARADAERKAAYVESSEAALKTYRRAGFVDVSKEREGVDGWMEFEFGGRRCAMVRRVSS